MKPLQNNRRRFIKHTVASVGLLSLPALLQAQPGRKAVAKKVVCVGAHPDDPETGCGGTLARLARAGHRVTIIYLTAGEAGITGASHTEAARIRTQEGINACKILEAKPVFAGQTDGATEVNNEWLKKMRELIVFESPDIIFTHWPVDYHPDHQVAGLLTIQAWMKEERKFGLYFYEVQTGLQTALFHPTDYVDITGTVEQKWKAVYCHKSQDPSGIEASGHRTMENFRGLELGVKAAEAFVRMTGRLQGEINI
ncbi:LmbE family protein [Niabella ginsenosidivorans]|uniref:LmbE family protein n=1 Tax=Niabella ginsenosidivorans TaxID=1176587 RepID=A0A1A9HY50_9BACT|nr:PIG-L deacetylase family protein [Niabella ginsenosidivorans]ANH79749.1 LmbE family protein [Niabella ginsenosidivorans]